MTDKIRLLLEHITELDADDRTTIRQLYAENGMELAINTRCPDCWRDAVIELAVRYGVTRSRYRFVGPVTMWQPYGIVLDAATDEATITKFIKEYPNQTIYETNI